MKLMPMQAKKLAATLKKLRLPDPITTAYIVEVQKTGSMKLKVLEMKIAESLIKRFPERFGWTNDPKIGGSMLVEAGSGLIISRQNNQPIIRPSKVIHKPVALIIKQEAEAHLRTFEGDVEYMYLDGNNKVTVGIGHHVKTLQEALTLPFVFKPQAKQVGAVSQADITREWQNVRAKSGLGLLAPDFIPLTDLMLESAKIESLFDTDFREHRDGAARNFPLTSYPKSVQLGVVDLTYVLGLTKLLSDYVKFQAALKLRNFKDAAMESLITKGSFDPARNTARKNLIALGIKTQPFFTTRRQKAHPMLKLLLSF